MATSLVRRVLAVCTVGLLLAQSAAPAHEIIKNPATGTPDLKSINVISFAPHGILLIGDGAGAQVVAIDTGDTTATAWSASAIEKIDEQIAAKIGATAKDVEIQHLAVNPASGSAYLSVLKQADKKSLLFKIDGTGKISEFSLEKVKYAAVPLPKGEKGNVTKVTDLAWGGDRLFVGAASNEEFSSKLFAIPTPLDASAKSMGYSVETYHVQHKKWETKAPMTSLMTLEEEGKKYVVGAFACTPVVRYSVDQVSPNGQLKGESVLELGSGNQPRNMFSYTKGGKNYVLMNIFRFQHDRKPYGPSPYVVMSVDAGLLSEKEKINEKALFRLNGEGNVATDRVKVAEAFHGTMHMDKLDKERVLVIKQDDKKVLTLSAIALP